MKIGSKFTLVSSPAGEEERNRETEQYLPQSKKFTLYWTQNICLKTVCKSYKENCILNRKVTQDPQ